ncbi:hypothetical protein HK105_200760 [Polyrhizophydium stewartii]|uniref:DNA helicase n=1 Tax=Polyrhizophydium stewartii TaxID=2732419 RepID=A0ABR4NJZ5_9FUNG
MSDADGRGGWGGRGRGARGGRGRGRDGGWGSRGRGRGRGGGGSYAPYPSKEQRQGRRWNQHVDDDIAAELRVLTNDSRAHGSDDEGGGRQRGGRADSEMQCPYPCWDLYFADSPYMPGHEYIPLVEHLTGFFGSFFDQLRDAESTDAFEQLIMQPVVMVDYKDLSAVLTDLGERLKSHPGALLGCLGMAATLVAMTHLRQDDYFDPVYDRKIVRIVGHPVVTPLKDLKSNLMGKFISIRGTVVRVSSVKPMTTQMAFLCTKCERTQVQVLVDGKFRAPIKCTTFGCRGKTFVADRSTDSPTHTIDWQRIRVQEKLADDQVDSGRIPRTVECELVQDLVDGVVPGDVVSVSGIVKVLSTDESKKKQSSQMYYLYIDTNSLSKAGGSSADQEESRSDGRTGLSKDYLHFSRKELYGIREIHEQPDVFRLLVHSLCPPIYGHEIVKAGLLLVLFGARRRDDGSGGVSIRSDPHILVVGDPGLGKSQMLSATVRAAPRGVYVCGNTTTTSGLTVTICKDADSGDTALEAGALVLGDQGVCCIDEFDKMVEHQALLEAMEQQSISIAKAGIVCSLPARTSVIAAANPVGGHYKLSPGSQSTIRVVIQKLMTRSSKAKTVSENLKMNGALLSRFDLVFILLDKPDERMDMFLSDHIMKNMPSGTTRGTGVSDRTLLERLRVGRDEVLHPIPLPLLRKYIAYARTYTKPRLTKEAALVLQRFYLTLRSKYRSVDSTPITTRQLESMIRLAEARARAELREEVTEQDAHDVVQIMKVSLWDTYEDDAGQIDFQRSGTSKKGEPKRFVVELQRIARQRGNSRFSFDELQSLAQGAFAAREIRLRYDSFPDMIESLNIQGYLLKKGFRQFELATV